MTTKQPTKHAAIAVTQLIEQCNLFSTDEDCAEAIVQAAIDAAVAQARVEWEKVEEETQIDGL